MEPKISTKLEALNKSLHHLLTYMNHLEPEQMTHRPDGAWSPAQVLQHMYLSEQAAVAYLKKKSQTPAVEVGKGGMGAKLRSFLLHKALRNEAKKYKAPRVAGDVDENPSYEEVKAQYLQVRKDLEAVLGQFDWAMMGRTYFKHPIAGRMNILQMLDFLNDHFQRHYNQIKERAEAV